MNPIVIQALFTQIVIPEVSRWLASRHSDAPFPSVEELTAQMNSVAAATITAGEAFLKSKGAL